jgi:hypothetical protein
MTGDHEFDWGAARARAQEYARIAEEECPDGGFLFGDAFAVAEGHTAAENVS